MAWAAEGGSIQHQGGKAVGGMCLLGQEIVGLGERGTRLLRKQAEAERQRGREPGGGGGRKGAPGAGMPAMFPLQAGVPDPLPDLLPAHAKAAARLWELRSPCTDTRGAEWQAKRCRQLRF